MTDWRSIHDFPYDDSIVDVWTVEYGRIVDVWWAGDEWSAGFPTGTRVTHWMPVPLPPKMEDGDNTRVLTQSGFLSAIGRFPTPKSAGNSDLAQLPAFLRAKNLEPFISNELARSSTPIIFESERPGDGRWSD